MSSALQLSSLIQHKCLSINAREHAFIENLLCCDVPRFVVFFDDERDDHERDDQIAGNAIRAGKARG